jgi:phosphatidylserine decarboxylase
MKIAKGSSPLIMVSFLLSLFLALLCILCNLFPFFVVLFLLSFFFLIFFRDPDRKIGRGIVAPADGKIERISEEKDEYVGRCTVISTFMNILNVHVNRMPIDGVIENVIHYKGSHIPAFKKDSKKNERIVLFIKSKIGNIKLVQIAGLLARRILPYVKKGARLKKGDRIGIIRFGSRVDLYLPKKVRIFVKVNDKVKAGADTIADY